MGSPCCLVYYPYYLSTAPLLSHFQMSSIHVKTHIQNRPIFCLPYFSKFPPDPRAVPDESCTGHIRGVPVLVRVLHVLPKYLTIAIDTGPSMVELVLDISESSRCWFLYYTLFKSVEHNDKRHSPIFDLWRTTPIFNHFGWSSLRKIALRFRFCWFSKTPQGCGLHCKART